VAHVGLEAAGQVVAGDAHLAVELRRALDLAAAVDALEAVDGHGHRALLPGAAGGDEARAQALAALARSHEDAPGLPVAVRGARLREGEDLADRLGGNGLGAEATHGAAGAEEGVEILHRRTIARPRASAPIEASPSCG